MEKIWIKKEFYFEKYEFLKFYTIFWFFIWFLINFLRKFLVKIAKKGEKLPAADVASGPRRGWRGERAHVARGSTAPLRRGAEATWQDACGPRKSSVKWQGGHVGARVGRHVLRSREEYKDS